MLLGTVGVLELRRGAGGRRSGANARRLNKMGFDRRGYYYRARKVDGRVVREYVGAGDVAALVAQMDDLEREKRKLARIEELARREEAEALDAPLDELDELTELLARAALLAAGYHCHKRGEWRKRRARRQDAK
jgi:hypothetical protein